jgi:hypothetical protein
VRSETEVTLEGIVVRETASSAGGGVIASAHALEGSAEPQQHATAR